MIITFSLFILTYIVLYILGLQCLILFKNEEIENYKYHHIFFSGLVVVSVLSSYFSIFIPLDRIYFSGVLIASSISFISNRKLIVSRLQQRFAQIIKVNKFQLFAYTLLFIFVLVTCSTGVLISDTSLYHAQAVKWINEFKVVPGLGNLHGRFAFNSLFFVISAVFSFDLGNQSLCFPINGLTFGIVTLFLLNQIITKFKTNKLEVNLFLIILFFVFITFPRWLSSLSPDVFCSLSTIYLLTQIINTEIKNKVISWLLIALIFTLISYKLSLIFMVVFVFILLPDFFSIKNILNFIFIGGFIMLPFVIRNIFISGYLVYPFHHIDFFTFDWKIPSNEVKHMSTVIKMWARIPYVAHSGYSFDDVLNMSLVEWLPVWFKGKSLFVKFILLLNLLSVLTCAVLFKSKYKKFFFMQFFIILNLVFWFIMAPTPRFVSGLLFFNIGLVVTFFLRLFKIENSKIITYVLILLFSLSIIRSYSFAKNIYNNPIGLLKPGGLKKAKTKTVHTNFDYFIPVKSNFCENHELPCTPSFNQNLILRDSSSLEKGFKIKNQND